MTLTAFHRRAAVVAATTAALTAAAVALPVAAKADGYVGAIAFSRKGEVFSRTKNAPSRPAAERAAMRACGYSDCKVLVTFTECGAVAKNSNGDYAGGYGPTLAAAQADALRTLGTRGWIGTWSCNSR